MKVNLHTHTRWSDGYETFQELIKYAKEQGLKYLAITDHDRTEAWSPRNIDENTPYFRGGIDVVSKGILSSEELKIIQGIELSSNDSGTAVHIIGLYIDQPDEEFGDYLRVMENERWIRAELIAKRLGIPLGEVHSLVDTGLPSRMHFGYMMFLREQQKDTTRQDPEITCARDAMKKYLGPQTEFYVPFDVHSIYTPRGAIQRILISGGIPIWAHPKRTNLALEDTFKRYRDYAEGKPFGIEVTDLERLPEMMEKFDLVTVGNDFHGYPYEPKDKPLALEVPDELIQRLNEAHKAITR